MKQCKCYVGVACVNGSCPKALVDEYAERGMDIVRSCKDCIFYEECRDCALAGTEYCVLSEEERRLYYE